MYVYIYYVKLHLYSIYLSVNTPMTIKWFNISYDFHLVQNRIARGKNWKQNL